VGAINYGTNFAYYSFLKFNLTPIEYLPSSRVISATLWLYVNLSNWVTACPVFVNEVTSAWDMNTLTWNAQPTVGSLAFSRTFVLADRLTWCSFDVTATVKNWMDNLVGRNGFRFIKSPADGDTALFYFTDGGANAAYIKVSYDSTSGPTSGCSLAYCDFDDGSRQGWPDGVVTTETPYSTPYSLKVAFPDYGNYYFGPTTDSFRVKFYINPKSIAVGDDACVLEFYVGTILAPRFMVTNNGAGYYLVIDTINPYQRDTIGEVSIGEWNQIVLDFDAIPSNQVRVWINGYDLGKYDTVRSEPAFTHNYDSTLLDYQYCLSGYFLLDSFCITSPVPTAPPPLPIGWSNPAIEVFPSSVRVGTRWNRRTRRGRGNG
jgi:hypothetical protein